jgi:hypothetical protein
VAWRSCMRSEAKQARLSQSDSLLAGDMGVNSNLANQNLKFQNRTIESTREPRVMIGPQRAFTQMRASVVSSPAPLLIATSNLPNDVIQSSEQDTRFRIFISVV